MSMSEKNIDNIEINENAYTVKLGDFEGPLDLLLHFVKEAKIEIKDIFVSDITEQYLKTMEQLDILDMDRAAEFVSVMTTLIEIKVRALTPKIEDYMPDGDDPKERLLRQIEEHKLFKEAGENLKTQENVSSFYKAPDDSAFGVKFTLKDMSIEGLINAFSKLLHKVDIAKTPVLPKTITKDRFTVAQKMTHIREVVFLEKRVKFSELFEEDYTKSEMINTFLALLELLKLHFVNVAQEKIFGEIIIEDNAQFREEE